MNFNKVIILTGESTRVITIDKTMDTDELIKMYDLRKVDIQSANLIKELKEIIQKENECIKNKIYDYAAKYRDKTWKLLSTHCNLDFKGANLKSSYFKNDTMFYVAIKIKIKQPNIFYCKYCGIKAEYVTSLTVNGCLRHPNGAGKGRHRFYKIN